MKEFTVSTEINAAPESVYEAWLDSEKHAAMTGAAAKVSHTIGAEFSAWDGYISGRNLELEDGKRILQTWRTVEFAEQEPDSIIEVLFDAIDGGTRITVIHSDLPAHGDQYKQGWQDSYFTPMRAYFK